MWEVICYNDVGTPCLFIPCETQAQAKAIKAIVNAKGREADIITKKISVWAQALARSINL